jgi:hypothetical protein
VRKRGSGKSCDIDLIRAMREAGASLQQIAVKIGRTKERVRQILVKNNGTTKHALLSTQQLCKGLGLPRNQILELYKDGIITAAVTRTTGNHHYLLWDSLVAEKIENHYNLHHSCKICGRIIGKGRWVYCSGICYKQGQKYRYKDSEARRRQLLSIKKYVEKRKLAGAVPDSSRELSPVGSVAENSRIVEPAKRQFAVVP